MYTILGVGTALKAALWLYCRSLQARSDSMAALAEGGWALRDGPHILGDAVAALLQ